MERRARLPPHRGSGSRTPPPGVATSARDGCNSSARRLPSSERSGSAGVGPAGLAEAVTHRTHRLDVARVFLAELRPQPADMHVDRARAAVVLVTPHARQQLFARE